MFLTLERVLILKQLDLFAEVDEEALIELATQMHESDVPAGQMLFQQGVLGRELIVCTGGKIQVNRTDQTSQEIVAPCVVGVLAALDPQPHEASVTTLTPCRLLRLDHDALINELLLNNTLAYGVIRYLVRQARQI